MIQRIFKDPSVLEEMLNLRRGGWPLKQLAIRYHCNPTAIRTACMKHGIPIHVDILKSPSITFKPVIIISGERINVGKTYGEYLKEYKERIKQLKHRGNGSMIV